MKPFEGKRYGKRAKEQPQIWNAQKKRKGRKKGQKVRQSEDGFFIETAAKMKTAAKAAKDKSAPRLNVASA